MKRCDKIRAATADLGQGLDLVPQNVEDKQGILLGIVQMTALQPPVLIVLDQVMVGILRERKRVEPQRVDDGLTEKLQISGCSCQVRQVERDDVVPNQELRVPGKLVQLPERVRQTATAIDVAFMV